MRFAALLSLMLTACSTSQVYESSRQNRLLECRQLPEAQQAECIEQYQDSFRDYEKKREPLSRPGY